MLRGSLERLGEIYLWRDVRIWNDIPEGLLKVENIVFLKKKLINIGD